MEINKQIELVFNCFHDGDIKLFECSKEKLVLKINCLYLAELIDKTFEYFFVELHNLSLIKFVPWHLENELANPIIDINKIFEFDVEINSSKIENDQVVINCFQRKTIFDKDGGALYLACDNIKVFDQNPNEISTENLLQLANTYWENLKT